jgi:tetratricopeptide (TPR) repeat protein
MPRPSPSSTAFKAFVIIVATLVAYLPAIRGGFLWDDDFYPTHSAVSQPGGFATIWTDYKSFPQYYPLVYTTYWIEYRVWGEHTLGYHLVNVLLHAGSAILLGSLLERLGIPGAWLAAAVFALHPVQVESVAWLTERKNVLSGFFYFLSLTAFARFTALDRPIAPKPRPWGWYAASLIFLVLALLSKTITASLPAVMLLLLWWKRRMDRTEVLALVPMFLMGAAFGLFTAWIEHHHVGAKGEEWNLTWVQRSLLAGRASWFYAWKLVWPFGLTFIYPRWQINAGAAWQYGFPLAVVSLLAALWRLRGRIGRGPLVAALCFVGTLLPALGFLNVFPFRYSFVADHFQYLACVFVIVPLSAALASWCRRFNSPAGRMLPFGVPAGLCVLTFTQARVYQDMESLWRDTIAKNPQAWMAHGNLGDCLAGQGRYQEAIDCYKTELALKPDNEAIFYNLGIALEGLGRFDEAGEAYQQALSMKPDYAKARVNFGALYARRGRFDEAINQFRKALAIRPDLEAAHYNLAMAMSDLGRYDEARRAYAEAIRLRPDYWEAWINDAGVLWRTGRVDLAIDQYREVLKRNPQSFSALLNLGSALMQQGNSAEGIEFLQQAVALKPTDPDARHRLALAHITLGRADSAAQELNELIRLKPDHPGIAELRNLLAKPPG